MWWDFLVISHTHTVKKYLVPFIPFLYKHIVFPSCWLTLNVSPVGGLTSKFVMIWFNHSSTVRQMLMWGVPARKMGVPQYIAGCFISRKIPWTKGSWISIETMTVHNWCMAVWLSWSMIWSRIGCMVVDGRCTLLVGFVSQQTFHCLVFKAKAGNLFSLSL